jgi:uncharacterized protein with FMN-binding domain
MQCVTSAERITVTTSAVGAAVAYRTKPSLGVLEDKAEGNAVRSATREAVGDIVSAKKTKDGVYEGS